MGNADDWTVYLITEVVDHMQQVSGVIEVMCYLMIRLALKD